MHKHFYALQQSKVGVISLIVSRFFSIMAFAQSTIVLTVLNSEFLKQ